MRLRYLVITFVATQALRLHAEANAALGQPGHGSTTDLRTVRVKRVMSAGQYEDSGVANTRTAPDDDDDGDEVRRKCTYARQE